MNGWSVVDCTVCSSIGLFVGQANILYCAVDTECYQGEKQFLSGICIVREDQRQPSSQMEAFKGTIAMLFLVTLSSEGEKSYGWITLGLGWNVTAVLVDNYRMSWTLTHKSKEWAILGHTFDFFCFVLEFGWSLSFRGRSSIFRKVCECGLGDNLCEQIPNMWTLTSEMFFVYVVAL